MWHFGRRKQPITLQFDRGITLTELKVSTSIGISIYPRDGTTVEALIMRADAAMYRAKQSKSGYAFASDNPTPQA